MEHGQFISKTFFIYEILAKQNIHPSKSMKFCPICKRKKDRDSSKEAKKHLELISIKKTAYHANKKFISFDKAKTMAC